MQMNPFKQDGKFWRGNLHTHSTKSDGRKSVEDTVQMYKNAGYDFLAVTDHFMSRFGYPITDTRAYQSDDFTTLLGAELHPDKTELGQMWHIVALGLPLDFGKPANDETPQQMVQRALNSGAFVVAAHPHRYNVSEADILSLGNIHALEVYNGASEDHNSRSDSWYLFDLLTARGHRYTACVGDDCHFKPDSRDFQLSWVWVKSETLSPDGLLEALKQGNYYSSMGPEIYDIDVQANSVTVRCSPVERIMITGFVDKYKSTGGQGVKEARLELSGFDSPYFRVIIRDSMGKMAWSNPIWF